MANTTNLNLNKLAGTEKLKTFPSPYNDNMDAIDGAFGAGFGVSGKPSVNAEINSLGDGLAILANGNTHPAITSGQFVYVRGHGTLTDGLYIATANIAENGTLSGSNLTADSAGGLNTVYNALNGKIGNNAIRCGTIDFECQASDWADWNGWKMLTKSVSVSFNGAFTQTPYVVATAYSSGNENLCSVLGIVNTKDGISTIYLSRPNTTYGSVKIRWIAIGT